MAVAGYEVAEAHGKIGEHAGRRLVEVPSRGARREAQGLPDGGALPRHEVWGEAPQPARDGEPHTPRQPGESRRHAIEGGTVERVLVPPRSAHRLVPGREPPGRDAAGIGSERFS